LNLFAFAFAFSAPASRIPAATGKNGKAAGTSPVLAALPKFGGTSLASRRRKFTSQRHPLVLPPFIAAAILPMMF
jgi:hypothetical protein